MALWKITSAGPSRVRETKPEHEKLLEEHLEEWYATDPSLLGEPLVIIGRQVLIPDVKDRLDLLALDPRVRLVVIELKTREAERSDTYAGAPICELHIEMEVRRLRESARTSLGKAGDLDFNFNEEFEKFCSDSGIDEVPDINTDQRMIVVGSEVKDKAGKRSALASRARD